MTSLSPRVKRILTYAAGALILVALTVLLQRRLHRNEFAQLAVQFKAAQLISPLPMDPKDSSHTIHWKSTLNLPGNVPINIEAASFFGEATARYSDESSQRVIAPGEDYIWPQELRLDPTSQVLYVRTSGLGGGIFPTTRLIAYDLRKRSRITRITLYKAEVPLLGQD
jgi:cell division septation protein DedD